MLGILCAIGGFFVVVFIIFVCCFAYIIIAEGKF